jgi:hypothetical protein
MTAAVLALELMMQEVWVADPLEKIFADAAPTGEKTVRIQTARNEFESAQIVVRNAPGVRVEFSDLAFEGHTIPASAWRCDFVGTIPVKKNTDVARPVRSAPADFPDPFREERTLDVPPDRAQPVWLTLFTPKDAAPGMYRGRFRVAGQEIAVEVEVWPITLPDERHLLYTNWFFPDLFAKQHNVAAYSDEFYKKLEPYLVEIAAHRQNILWVMPDTILTAREPDGSCTFDYTRFDRYIETISRHGLAERIEIAQIGAWPKFESEDVVFHPLWVTDRKSGQAEASKDRELRGRWLAALQAHLKEKGWLDKSLLHVCDEPHPHHDAAYRAALAFVREHAPALKVIDAVETPDLGNLIDVQVPKLTHFHHWREAFEKSRAELWFYTCCHPTGAFPNRFVQNLLVQTRLLHWINRRYRMPGYLHWGLNYWQPNDWSVGDSHIVYPGPLGSIRWEAVRDGIEDYEYFWLLDQAMGQLKKRLKAEGFDERHRGDAIAGLAIRSCADTIRKPDELRALRRKIVEAILEAQSEIPVLMETSPRLDETLTMGPALVAIRGVTLPDVRLLVNGRHWSVQPDGRFASEAYVTPQSNKISVTLQRGETTVRRVLEFRVNEEH